MSTTTPGGDAPVTIDVTGEAPEERSVDDELATLRKARDERDAKRRLAAKKRQIEAEKLTLKYEESLGRPGVDFDVITTDVGNFVIKKAEFVVAKRFIATEKKTEEDAIQFVLPSLVYPTNEEFNLLVSRDHAGIAWRCANALIAMYEGRAEELAGKF